MADTVVLVILGASGDLTHRLLLPGLGTLLKAQPKRKVHLVGASADELTQEQWQQRVTESVREGGCSADVVTQTRGRHPLRSHRRHQCHRPHVAAERPERPRGALLRPTAGGVDGRL
ncbi:MAG: hypothetical protein R2742_13725 [Micropruina glycogenica]